MSTTNAKLLSLFNRLDEVCAADLEAGVGSVGGWVDGEAEG